MWSATIFSATGTFVQSVAGSWLMLELTGSNTWVGLMVSSSTLPLLFFSLTAGALADMFDRAKIMVLAQSIMALSALSMALLTHFGKMTPVLLLLLGLMLGLGGTEFRRGMTSVQTSAILGVNVSSPWVSGRVGYLGATGDRGDE